MNSLKMVPNTRQSLLLLILVLVGVCVQLSQAEQSNKDVEEQQVVAPSTRTGKLLVPEGLTRFFFYNTRANERQSQAGSPVGGYKRSSSALDALTGVTLGKRSAPVDLINFEPAFLAARQLPAMRQSAASGRLYEPRWVPSFEALEAPLDYN